MIKSDFSNERTTQIYDNIFIRIDAYSVIKDLRNLKVAKTIDFMLCMLSLRD